MNTEELRYWLNIIAFMLSLPMAAIVGAQGRVIFAMWCSAWGAWCLHEHLSALWEMTRP